MADIQTDLGPITQAGNLYMNGGYGNGPWTYYTGDIISQVAAQGSPLEDWIPFRLVKHQKESVSHLSWVVADGWDGDDDTYKALIDGMEIEQCNVADLRSKFDTCQYIVEFGESSASTDTLRLVEDMNMKEYENSQQIRIRTAPGQDVFDTANNAQWQLSLMMNGYQNHLRYNLAYGVKDDNPKMWSDGLTEVIRNGYVDERKVGGGSCDNNDPIIIDGTTLATAEDLLITIQTEVSQKLEWARMWGLPINVAANDIVVVLPRPMWRTLTAVIAVGGLLPVPKDWITGGMTPMQAEVVRQRFMSGGLGYGYIPVDGFEIPIIPGDEFARNTLGNTHIVSDVWILTRRAGGINLLENQWYDWANTQAPNTLYTYHQGGGIRQRVFNENDDCYKFAVDAKHRLISRLQPLQTRITSATVRLIGSDRLTTTFFHGAHYANGGVPGSIGPGWKHGS